MNIAQIENNLQQLVKVFKKKTFIYDLLLAYGLPKASITRLQKGGLNLSKEADEISWKKKLFFKSSEEQDLHELIDDLKKDDKSIKHDPRFLIVTDFETLLAIDRKTSDTLDIPILDIAKHFDFFLPWAGMEKAQHQIENPADVKAAVRMAKLYDEIKKDNPAKKESELHNLNVFLSRLLFCFFAEDTGIFEKGKFTNAVGSHTQSDGSDMNIYLDKLFDTMNTESGKRKNIPAYLNAFPYVNGGLFKDKIYAPVFTKRSREALIKSGELDWSAINPDIFGSMMQAVVRDMKDDDNTKHYTSVPNIMKVIEPLFLNELYEEFESAKRNTKKLNTLSQRIRKIKIFDPACGSGNFLIIAYKELRRLEMKIFKAINALFFSNISLKQFYGIELDDFAHEVAILSLWLAEHQMNQEFSKEFGRTRPALPLKEAGKIIHGNATRIDWEKVCPKTKSNEIYVLGNPPYLGSSMQSEEQKKDMELVFHGFEGFRNLDYISCWFLKGSEYIQKQNAQFAFVSTNSICQGEQVALLWPRIFKLHLEIGFTYTSFKWTNNAKSKAAVIVIIVGVRNLSKSDKIIFKDKVKQNVLNINAYLIPSSNIIFERRSTSISNFPELVRGSMPTDDGNFTLTFEEKDKLINAFPFSEKYIKKMISGGDFLNDKERYCLWILDKDLKEAKSIPFINKRLVGVRDFRLKSDAPSTVEYAKYPNRFRQIAYKESNCIVIPLTSSIRRKYIPFSFLSPGTVVTNSAGVIYDAKTWHFGVICSLMHMVWVSIVAGRLKSDYRYSNVICYNNFPFPNISQIQKQELERNVYRILEERENHSEKTLAQLYDPNKMPDGLLEAHRQNDLAVERCYRSKPFENDEERLEYLFKLYEQMIEEEKERNGELNFNPVKTKKGRSNYGK